MINLDIARVKNFELKYLEYMKDRVLTKLNAMPLNHINPFTSLPVKFDLSNTDINTEQFIEDILIGEIDELCEKYPKFEYYFKTAQFCYYSNLRLSKELPKNGEVNNPKNRENYRKQYVFKYNNPWIINIIRCYPEYYKTDVKFKELQKNVKNKLEELNKSISEVINYDLIKAEERHTLLYELDIEVCPYCNRNFISKYRRNGKLRTTADLDHFLPKSNFSFLSLSLHNFVPSCQICNSRFKSDKGIEIINPYNEKMDYNKFKFKHNMNKKSDISIFYNESNDFEIKIDCQNIKYLNNIELFELEKLYNTHKSLVAEIVYKKEAYNNSYQELFNNLFDEINFSEEEKCVFLYGIEMDENKLYKKPLSKLIYDIVKYD